MTVLLRHDAHLCRKPDAAAIALYGMTSQAGWLFYPD
jgi:hypothetical protein